MAKQTPHPQASSKTIKGSKPTSEGQSSQKNYQKCTTSTYATSLIKHR